MQDGPSTRSTLSTLQNRFGNNITFLLFLQVHLEGLAPDYEGYNSNSVSIMGSIDQLCPSFTIWSPKQQSIQAKTKYNSILHMIRKKLSKF